MNTDRYTKGVLTVIAACLLWICVMGIAPPVTAQVSTVDFKNMNTAAQPVILVGTGTMDQAGRIAVNFLERSRRTDPTVAVSLPYSAANPMPVQLPYTQTAPIPVEITAVKKTGDWEPIRASVEDAPTRPKPGGGGPGAPRRNE
jgi:hypothetical protein